MPDPTPAPRKSDKRLQQAPPTGAAPPQTPPPAPRKKSPSSPAPQPALPSDVEPVSLENLNKPTGRAAILKKRARGVPKIVYLVVSPLVLLVLGWLVLSSRSADPERRPSASSGASEAPAAQLGSIPREPKFPITLKVDATEPGFFVLIDGEPARDVEDQLLKTPCEVVVERGSRQVTVAKKGFAPKTEVVTATQPLELILDAVEETSDVRDFFSAPFFDAPVGRPIPLSAVNAAGTFNDPFVSPDGLSLWLAGTSPEGRGVFVASRPSRFDEFDPPVFLPATKSSEECATPSLSADGLLVAYAVPEKSRIWGLQRTNPLAAFEDRIPLVHSSKTVRWPSAQLLGDGKSLVWEELQGDKRQTYVVTREAIDFEFSKPRKLTLPGGRPCFSQDGLRQFTCDGKKVERARRADLKSPFIDTRTIAELDLPNYDPDPARRQFFVTEDEQWLFYAADPAGRGALHVVRLSLGPSWGVVPRGKPLPKPLPRKTETMPDPTVAETDPEEMPEKPAPAAGDDARLPYVAFLEAFRTALDRRELDQARKAVTDALADARFAEDKEQLAWDAADVEDVIGFWEDVRKSYSGLKANDPVRVAGQNLNLVEYDADSDTLIARGKTKDVEKIVAELTEGDLLWAVDRIVEKTDGPGQMRIARFLYYDTLGKSGAWSSRADRAAEAGAEFRERLAQRQLHVMQQYFAREDISSSLRTADEILAAYAKSDAAQAAAAFKAKAYTFIQWEPVGSRDWTPSEDGQYFAAPTAAAGSYLLSPKKYKNFELTLEWKTEGATGQGGVYFRYVPGERLSDTSAFKLQLASDAGVRPDKFSTGALFNVTPPRENAVKPTGEWNTLQIRTQGENVVVVINGKTVLEGSASNKDIPLEGHICLDGALGGITYRKILVLDLPDSP